MTTPSDRLKFLLNGTECTPLISVFDPLSARMTEDLGFPVAMIGGSIASLVTLGAPDINILTLTELAGLTRRVCRSTALPVIVDADNGYGNALNTMRCVQELEHAGAAAAIVEDSVLGSARRDRVPALVPLDEAVGKVRAAVAARHDSGFSVLARTNAGAISVEEAAERIRAYSNAGADGICLFGVRDREHLAALSPAAGRPIMLVRYTGAPLDPPEVLSGFGVRLYLEGHSPYLAAVEATYETLRALHHGVPMAQLGRDASGALIAQTTRASDYEKWRETFLL